MQTVREESRGPRVADGAARADVPRPELPVTGGRRVPRRKDSSSGTAGNFPAARFASARGAYQVLVRLQYLRTQLQGWKRTSGAGERGQADEVLQGLRGLHAAARHAGLPAYEHMCQSVAESLGPLSAARRVPPQVLGGLLEWLAASERHVRHPKDRGACRQLQAPLDRMAAAVQGALR